MPDTPELTVLHRVGVIIGVNREKRFIHTTLSIFVIIHFAGL